MPKSVRSLVLARAGLPTTSAIGIKALIMRPVQRLAELAPPASGRLSSTLVSLLPKIPPLRTARPAPRPFVRVPLGSPAVLPSS